LLQKPLQPDEKKMRQRELGWWKGGESGETYYRKTCDEEFCASSKKMYRAGKQGLG
jgi:hypothetical protein